jgi:predicted amidophosphoribosyltransferase
VAGAFAVGEPGWARGRQWMLVDDVATTGSTLHAAARVLREAGASRVVPVALALA